MARKDRVPIGKSPEAGQRMAIRVLKSRTAGVISQRANPTHATIIMVRRTVEPMLGGRMASSCLHAGKPILYLASYRTNRPEGQTRIGIVAIQKAPMTRPNRSAQLGSGRHIL